MTKTASLNEGIVGIGFEAFALCEELRELRLPKSLIYLDIPITYKGRIIVEQDSYADYALKNRNEVEIVYIP